jgi:hypothetical protein
MRAREGRAALEAERNGWGTVGANTALDGFLELDRRMKSIVTAGSSATPRRR